MKSKAVSGIMLTLLLMGMLTLAFNIQPVKGEAIMYRAYVRFSIWWNPVADSGEIVAQYFLLQYSVGASQLSMDTVFIDDFLLPGLEFYLVQSIPDNAATYDYDTGTGKMSIAMDFSLIPSTGSKTIDIIFYMSDVPGYEVPKILEENPSFSRFIEPISTIEYYVYSQVSSFQIIVSDELVGTQIFVILWKDLHTVMLIDYSFGGEPYENPYECEVDWFYSATETSIPSNEAVFSVAKGDTAVSGYNVIWLVYKGMPIRKGDFEIRSSNPEDTFSVEHYYEFGYHNHWQENLSPPTITEAIENLIEILMTWNLPKGTQNSMTAILKGSLHLLDIRNENGAIHKLMGFTNQVAALRGKKLTIDHADYLISEAQRIIDLIQE